MENYQSLTIFGEFSAKLIRVKENLREKVTFFREFGAQKPTHIGGQYPYRQNAKCPPPLPGRKYTESSQEFVKIVTVRAKCDLAFTVAS